MKLFSRCLLIGLAGALCIGRAEVRADLEVSASVQIHAVSDFHAPLLAHGTWIEVGTYGRCWRPARVAVGWQPYCYGRWAWTDCGWYWVSDEPWGWACYHYGYWAYDSHFGWIWVPGIEWAPAWVSWRFGGGYCGWAPLAPPGVVIAPRAFVFVEVARFREPVRPTTVIVNNTTILNKTTVVGSLKRETRTVQGGPAQKVVINEGPSVEEIRKATGKTVDRISVKDAARSDAVPSEAVTKINESRRSQKPMEPKPGKNEVQPAPAPNAPEPPGSKKPDVTRPAPVKPDQVKPQPVVPSRESPPRDGIGPAPQRPLVPDRPSGSPGRPDQGQKKGSGKSKDRD